MMLDPALWNTFPDGMPTAIFPRRFASAPMGGEGVLLVEYAEHPEEVQTGPWKTIQIYLNPALAQHFHTLIDATIAEAPAEE
ncbi:hypothetical protein [Allosphingosinicella sp.]|uniref:hypothetical protein n=1 Tax=Allosphingosinicella sp. TaxID=2823234 RepID=UPI0037833224